MRLQLTYQQANALFELFNTVIAPLQPCDLAELLVYKLLMRIYRKLRAKVERVNPRSGYGLPLTDEEALAYYLYFNNRCFGDQYMYERNFIQLHINQLNQKYA